MHGNVTPIDSHTAAPHGTAHESGTPSHVDPSWDLVHILTRTLRGRYRLTFILCMVAGAVGAGVGWFWAGPLYRSDGMVRISSVLPSANPQSEQNQPIPMFESFMESQQGLITSRSLLEKALQEPIWDQKGIGAKRPSVPDLAANLKVEVRGRSENLRIGYIDPSAAVASAVVESTIAAYQKVFVQANQELDQQRLQSLENYRNTLPKQLEAATATTQPAASLPVALTPSSSDFELPSAEKVALVDPTMARLIERREDAGDQLKEACAEFGPDHPSVLRLAGVFEIASQRVDQYLAEYIAFHPPADDATTIPGAAATEAKALPSLPLPASLLPAVPQMLSDPMQQTQDELNRVNRQIDLLKAEAAMPKQFEIVDAGDLPVPVAGRQIKWTISGGGLCAGLTLGCMVLLGSRNRRYLFYRDVIENIGKKLRFIAAVPDLLATSKRQYSADAAQSIHYLRNKLEQNGNVFMVTSADWGEGRTSVVMSLALSLCGAGARTLVIDADLETRGLSRDLDMDHRPGLIDMLRDVNAKTPNMPGNSIGILPAGAANVTDGLSISASAVARLLKRLKDEFDVVLIDAGPVLGRVETCVMARQVDGVLLTICRGQQQSLWDKALEELDSVGAAYGAIFNRAKPNDFDRFVQPHSRARANLQQRPIAGPLEKFGEKFGPLVEAVAMSLTHEVEFFPIYDGATVGSKKVA
jgi:Mrp family chromosome partitioning ATPase/capsular polysaccharide biosynthesis protein